MVSAPVEGISIREFAKRDGCNDKVVRRKIASGHLQTLTDGQLDQALVGTGWRKRNADSADKPADIADTPAVRGAAPSLEEEADRLVFVEGRVFDSEAEAKRHKESFLAHLRQLEYDRECGTVVPVEDVVAAVVGEYAKVRNRLLSIPARVAPRVAHLRSPEEIKALIEQEVAQALEELTCDARAWVP
jgi:hypothetical protein